MSNDVVFDVVVGSGYVIDVIADAPASVQTETTVADVVTVESQGPIGPTGPAGPTGPTGGLAGDVDGGSATSVGIFNIDGGTAIT